jgi:hypothetical protein
MQQTLRETAEIALNVREQPVVGVHNARPYLGQQTSHRSLCDVRIRRHARDRTPKVRFLRAADRAECGS